MAGFSQGSESTCSTPPIATAKRAGAKAWQNKSAYATGFQVSLGGRPVTILGGYCRGGAPEAVFKKVAAATAGWRRAFILAADFNQSPQQLARHPLSEKMRAGVVSTGRATCRTKDGKESEIDFVIASRCLIGAINLKVCWEVPFGTHAALILKVNARPEAWSILAPCAPKILPGPVEKPAVNGGEAQHEEQRNTMWFSLAEAQGNKQRPPAAKGSAGETAEAIEELGQKCRCKPEAERASEAYGRWVDKVETFLLSEADIDPNSRRASAYKGRAQMPKLAKKRIEASPIPAKDLLVTAGYGYKARALATLK